MITAATQLLGPVDCSALQIADAVHTRPGAPAYDRATVEEIAAAIVDWTARTGLRTSIVAGQIMHETGWLRFGGDVRPEQFNFAGLGATGDVPGAGFATIDDGVAAVCAHHLVYIHGPEDRWPANLRALHALDPRYQAVVGTGLAGSVTLLGDHRGKWAFPGREYPERVAASANVILETTIRIGDFDVMIPNAEECFIEEGRSNRPGHLLRPRFITIHETANPAAGAGADTHCRYIRSDDAANRPASWHATVDDAKIVQHLPLNEVAWHAGDGTHGEGNRNSLAIELCVNRDGDFDATMARAAGVVAWMMQEFSIPLANVVPHNRWNAHTSCPAKLSAGRWNEFIELVESAGDGESRIVGPHGVRLEGPFLQLWDGLGGEGGKAVHILGWPLADAFAENGRPTMYFEGQVWSYVEENDPPWDLQRELLGAEAWATRHGGN